MQSNIKISCYNTIKLPFLSVALHELGTRNALLIPWQNNTEVYSTPFISTQNYTIVSDLRQVGGFLRVLRFPSSIKLTAMI